MNHARRAATCLAVAMIALSTARDARASEVDSARALAEAAADHLDDKKFAEALDEATRAEALYHAPTHLLLIAEAFEGLGRLAEAADAYDRLVSEPIPAKGAQVFRNAQETATTRLKALIAKVPSLAVVVGGAALGAARVTVDRQAFPTEGAKRLDPGDHVVRVEAEGFEPFEQTVTLPARGGVTKIDAHLRRSSEAQGPRPDGPLAANQDTEGSLVPAGITFAIGGAALVVGAVTGGVFLSNMGELQDQCPDNRCPASARDQLDQTGLLGNVSTVMLGVGGAAVLVGIVLAVVQPGGGDGDATMTAPVSVTPWVGPTSAGLEARF